MRLRTNNAVKLCKNNPKSNPFANYFIKNIKHLETRTIKAKDAKPLLNMNATSKLNLILASKKFGADHCQICA